MTRMRRGQKNERLDLSFSHCPTLQNKGKVSKKAEFEFNSSASPCFTSSGKHTLQMSFLPQTDNSALILLFPFASHHSPPGCLLDNIYAGLNRWLTLEQIELPKLGNL